MYLDHYNQYHYVYIFTPQPADQIMVSEVYHPLFERKRRELASLVVKIIMILRTNNVSLGELKFILCLYPELKTDVAAAESLEDAIVVVLDHTSLVNTNYFQAIAENFDLPIAIDLIKKYNESINEFCEEMRTTHAYGQEFMKRSSGLNQKLEVQFVLGWDADDKTVSDIRSLLTKAFHDRCKALSVITGRNVVLKREHSTGIEVDSGESSNTSCMLYIISSFVCSSCQQFTSVFRWSQFPLTYSICY